MAFFAKLSFFVFIIAIYANQFAYFAYLYYNIVIKISQVIL